jgi:SWI/SNF-related matrix-associated actin-dependent regulator of chromatin subfamily A-like protein 1
MTDQELIDFFPWGKRDIIDSDKGIRYRWLCFDSQRGLKLFNENKERLESLGIFISKVKSGGRGQMVRWAIPPPDEMELIIKRREMSRATKTDFEVPIPEGMVYYDYQKAGIAFAAHTPNVLIADEMGLGKTIQAIGLINWLNRNGKVVNDVIVCVPAHLIPNWVSELRTWLTEDYSIGVVQSGCFPTSEIVLVSHQSSWSWFVKGDLHKRAWDLVIVDECQGMRNRKTKMTRAIFGFKASRKDIVDDPEIKKYENNGIPGKRKVCLSGTPAEKQPADVWPAINYLDPVTWGDYNKFAWDYCGGCVEKKWTDKGASNTERFQKLLRSTIMIARLKKDVLKDLPPKIRSTVILSNDGIDNQRLFAFAAAQNSAWGASLARTKAEMEFAKTVSFKEYLRVKKQLDAIMENAEAASTEVVHATAVAKIPKVVEYIRSVEDQIKKMILFAYHRDVLEAYHKEFNDSVLIYGGMDANVRHELVNRFQNVPSVKKLIASHANASGYNATAASHVFFAEESWLPARIAQAEDRAHRNGQLGSVSVVHLVLKDSIDHVLAERTIERQTILDQAFRSESDEQGEDQEKIIPIAGLSTTCAQLDEVAKTIPPDPSPNVIRTLLTANDLPDAAQRFGLTDAHLLKLICEAYNRKRFFTARENALVYLFGRRHFNPKHPTPQPVTAPIQKATHSPVPNTPCGQLALL